jgi:Spy/CpxP family protein refolding chaperone
MSLATDLLAQATHLVQLRQSDRSRRHLADYDTSAKFDRLEVTALIQETTTAFNHWQVIKAKSNAKIFLMDLLLRKSWLRT